MAQIPVYGGPQIERGQLRTPMQGNIDVSSGTQALAQGLGQVAQVVERKIERDAQDEAFKLETQLRNDWQQHRAKLREQYKGEQADQYQAAAEEWWAQAPQKYGAEASPLARRLATRSLAQYQSQAVGDTLGYVEGEKKRARDTNFRTLQSSLQQEALTSVTPANAIAIGADLEKKLTENAIRYATLEGVPDAGPAMAKEQLMAFHSQVALSLAGRPDPAASKAAKEYLATYGGSMEIKDRTRVMDMIDIEADKTKTKIIQSAQGNLMLAVARRQYPKTAEINALAALDPNAAAEVQRAINAQIKADRAEAKGESIKTDPATYLALRSAISKGEITDPAQLTQFKDRVALGQLDSLSDLMNQAKKPAEQDSLYTTQQRTEAAIKGLGIDPKKRPEEALALTNEIDRRLRAASTAKGKKLTPDEEQKVVDEVALDKVYVDEFGRDPNKPRALLTPDEFKNAYVNVQGKRVDVSVVPPWFRSRAEASLRAAGKPPSMQSVVEDWLEYQRQKNTQSEGNLDNGR